MSAAAAGEKLGPCLGTQRPGAFSVTTLHLARRQTAAPWGRGLSPPPAEVSILSQAEVSKPALPLGVQAVATSAEASVSPGGQSTGTGALEASLFFPSLIVIYVKFRVMML